MVLELEGRRSPEVTTKKEYRVTFEEIDYAKDGCTLSMVPEVDVPEESGWSLVGMAASSNHIFWTWMREK